MGIEQNFIDSDVFYDSAPDEPTEAGENPEVETEAEPEGVEAEAETETETEVDEPRYQLDEDSGEYIFKANGQETRANVDKLVELASKGLGFEKKNASINRREEARSKEHREAIARMNAQAEELTGIADGLEALLQEEQTALDSEIDDLDPTEYLKRDKALKARREQVKTAKSKAEKARESQLQQTVNEQWEKLKEVMAWDTQEKVEDGFKEINDYAKSIGMGPDDIKGIYSHKVYQALSDAAKYRALLAKTSKTIKEVKSAPKSVKSKKTSKPKAERSAEEVLYGS